MGSPLHSPICQRQHIPVVVVSEPPGFLRLDAQQLPVAVPREVLHVRVRVHAHVLGVGPRLRYPAVHIVAELHPEHLHAVDGERHLGLQEPDVGGPGEVGGAVVQVGLVELRPGDLEGADRLDGAGLRAVREAVGRKVLASDSALRTEISSCVKQYSGERAQSRLGYIKT